MEHISCKFSELELKCDTIDKCIQVLEQRDALENELKTIKTDLIDILGCEVSLEELKDKTIRNEYLACTRKMMNVQLKMLFILENLPETKQEKREPLHELLGTSPSMSNRASALEAFSVGNTPSMSLIEYQNSPFVRKSRPISLHFYDFDVEISDGEFARIPHYLKSRMTCSELNDFLQNTIIKCFNDKYALFYKKRNAIKPAEVPIWHCYQEQNSYFNGEKFITQGDISRLMNRIIDKKTENKLGILRHLCIVKEKRKSSTICYLWVKKS